MGLYENVRNEPVSNLALREAVLVPPEMSLREADKLMQRKELGCIIVVGEDGMPLGTYTEEVLIRLLACRPAALDEPVKDHLSPRWACVRRDEPIAKVLEAMQKQDLRFICVTEQSGMPVALTGQKGLMEYVADHFPQLVMSQRVGAKSSTAEREGA